MEPYRYRRSTFSEQDAILDERQARGYPLHAPPHQECETRRYLLTAACYQHQAFLNTPERRLEFEEKVLNSLQETVDARIYAWCILPNHYHVVVEGDLLAMGKKLHRLHNGTSTGWNRQDGKAGRKVWYRYSNHNLRTERMFRIALNYVHANAVKHGYVAKAENWPNCSARQHLETVGRLEAQRLWKQYPVADLDASWDEPNPSPVVAPVVAS